MRKQPFSLSIEFTIHNLSLFFFFLFYFDHLHLLKPSPPTPSSSSLSNPYKANIMDLDFRASTIPSANHLSSLQAARLHSENYSVYSCTDGDDDIQSLFQCPYCDFEIEVSVLRNRLGHIHSYEAKNMVCPVCDEKLGEEHSSSQKRTWKSEKSSIPSGHSAMLDKKLASWVSRHEPVPDLLSPPFVSNVSVPNPSGMLSDDDSISSASDISTAKSFGTDAAVESADEQDPQEKRQRASFVQELIFSTLI